MVQIGWGRREISLDEPLSIRGQAFLRISEAIHDPMYATVLCITGADGKDSAIFCSLDMLALRRDLLNMIREEVTRKLPQIPVDHILFNATHTHCGGFIEETAPTSPDGKTIYSGLKYRDFVVRQCADAILEAWSARKTGGIGYGYGYAVVAHQRRAVYFSDQSQRFPSAIAPNGYGIMYGNTDDEQFSHFENGADHFLNLMFTFDPQEKLTGIVVNVPCPAQVGGQMTQQSADYWHEVRKEVRKVYGDDVYVLTQCAPAGDLSPRVLHYREAQERRMGLKYGLHYTPRKITEYNRVMAERFDIAQRITAAINEVYSWARKDIQWDFAVRCICKKLMLKRRLITDDEAQQCAETIDRMCAQIPEQNNCTEEEYRKAFSRYQIVKNRNNRVLQRFEQQQKEAEIEATVYVIQLGDIAFASNQFELFQSYMHRVQARSPFVQTFMVQLAGDGMASYLPTAEAVDNCGYSASVFCNQVGPEGGQQLVEATLQILNELFEM